MKAILGNFTKISETEFRLKKDLQFADISLDDNREIQTVQYQDKQDIQIGDILTHQDIDYEILSINADRSTYISVKVKSNIQEQDIPEEPKFIARKMTHRKPIPTVKKPKPIQEKVEEVQKVEEVIKEEEITPIPEPIVPEKATPTTTIPKKRTILKRLLGWIGTKLSTYSDR